MKVHLNWSGCRDWHDARRRIREALGSTDTMYRNFAYIECEDAAKTEQALKTAGFTVQAQAVRLTDYEANASYVLYNKVEL